MEQFLLFLIIGIISLVLNRKKEKPPEQQQRPPQRQQPFQPVHRNEEQRRDIKRPSASPIRMERMPSKDLEEVAEPLYTKPKPQIKSKQEEMQQQMEDLKKREESHRQKVTQVQTVHSSKLNDQVKKEVGTFQSKDILNGIIMAEVLGPPRSKKPYRRKY